MQYWFSSPENLMAYAKGSVQPYFLFFPLSLFPCWGSGGIFHTVFPYCLFMKVPRVKVSNRDMKIGSVIFTINKTARARVLVTFACSGKVFSVPVESWPLIWHVLTDSCGMWTNPLGLEASRSGCWGKLAGVGRVVWPGFRGATWCTLLESTGSSQNLPKLT